MMEVNIDKIPRIGGHASIYVEIIENRVRTRFSVDEFRGFEKFLINRAIEDIPYYVSRVCGICEVSHLLASTKALENGLGVEIPINAKLLRNILLSASVIQSHILHFIYMGVHDIVNPLEPVIDPLKTLNEYSKYIKPLLNLRAIAKRLFEIIGGRKIHPVTVIIGGLTRIPDKDSLNEVIKNLKTLLPRVIESIDFWLSKISELPHQLKIENPMNTAALLNGSELELYDGDVELRSPNGESIARFKPHHYLDFITEEYYDCGFSKSSYIKSLGIEQGIYRVGPLPRILRPIKLRDNAASLMNKYNSELKHCHFSYNVSRLIEVLHLAEDICEKLQKLTISNRIRVPVELREGEGIGIVEAPRGILIHHYRWDEKGIVKYVNIITPTAQNTLPISKDVQINVQKLISEIPRNKLRYLIAVIVRSYDPCIPCAGHRILVKIKHH